MNHVPSCIVYLHEEAIMITVFTLGILAAIGLGIALVVGVVVGLLKLAFKIVLIPVSIGLFLLKVVILVPLAILMLLVFLPVVLGVGAALLLPVLIIGALVWGVVHVFAAA
jgi:hypothetical protein